MATFAIPVVLALLMLPLGAVSFDFMPAQQTGEISMTVTYPPGTPIAVTNGYVSHLEDAIMKIDGIKSVSATTGRKPAGWSSVTGGNYAQLNAQMQDGRIKDTNNAIKSVRKLGYLVPGSEFDVAGDNGNGPAIYYSLTGPDESLGPGGRKGRAVPAHGAGCG